MRQRLITVLLACLSLLSLPLQADAEPSSRAQVAEQKARVLERTASSESTGSVPASVTITRQGVQAVDPDGTAPLDDAITCMARTVYWEARGTDTREMEAVAEVVMNRLGSPEFPDTVCGVVRQGSEQGSCQFSWWCDGRPDQATSEQAYAYSREIARRALNGDLPQRTRGALFFHHRGVSPAWADHFKLTVSTEEFIFYKPGG
ncbi:spore germination cell wall hydrolase CwlJ-like protein [Kushneria sinocarnis]|uniref:Spore germination cell wall hydrolase CwlJ-like protein n=1 Tax=Kushneria sinocarnis TaxID=595502 RepID=A0A420WW92_9GAMM|nr:cell wall hydrolase [Kushneria sinocarnis]RKR03381.1 spore germination cell wall hydrolase CwlJ-like protein [Kushneria sinocarnis]